MILASIGLHLEFAYPAAFNVAGNVRPPSEVVVTLLDWGLSCFSLWGCGLEF